MTSPENTPAHPDQPDAVSEEELDVDVRGYSVPPADDPDNPEQGPYGE